VPDEFNIKRLKSGDTAEFERLVRVCEARVYNLALRYTNNEADAADVAQEVFLRVYRALPDFKGDSAVTTWVYRITVNTAIDSTRRRGRRKEITLTTPGDEDENAPQREITDETYSPEGEYEKTELREEIGAAIAALSDEHRAVIILRDVNGMSYDEIGDILKLSEGTVKSRLFRARDKLRAALARNGNFSERSASKSVKGGSEA
jgi:RNA polymerase sigma-70 factor (ECF subfamily)